MPPLRLQASLALTISPEGRRAFALSFPIP